MRFLSLIVALLLVGCGSGLKPLYSPVGGTTPTGSPTQTTTLPTTAATPSLGRKVTAVQVPLRTGWNPVGFQATQVTNVSAPPTVLGMTSYSPSGYTVTGLTGIDGRRGYWVYATANATLTYDGEGEANSLDLFPGWNLVSIAGPTPVSKSALTPAVNLLVQELQPDGSSVPTETFQPGKAYWVFAQSAVRVTWSTIPAVTSLRVTPANSTVIRYSSVQLTATGTLANGTTQDLSSQVQWTSSEPSAVGIGPTGLATGLFPATVTITATLQGQSANANVTVTDSGTPGPLPSPARVLGRLYASRNVSPYNLTIFAEAPSKNGAAPPTARVQGAATQLNTPNLLAVDTARDILYVPCAGQVNIYNNASAIEGVPVNLPPSKVVTGLPTGSVQCLIDPVADRLYVSLTNGALYQWDNISTNPAPTEANRSRLLTGIGASPTICLDRTTNRLFSSNTNDLILYVYDNASSLDGVASAATRRLLTSFIQFGNHGLLYDSSRELLYASNTAGNSVEVFVNPGPAPSGPFPPARTITGLSAALGLALDRTRNELYVARVVAGASIPVLANPDTQNGPAVISRTLSVDGSIGLDFDPTR